MNPTINDIIGIIESNREVFDIQLNDGASKESIGFFEQTLNVSLPEDFVISINSATDSDLIMKCYLIFFHYKE